MLMRTVVGELRVVSSSSGCILGRRYWHSLTGSCRPVAMRGEGDVGYKLPVSRCGLRLAAAAAATPPRA